MSVNTKVNGQLVPSAGLYKVSTPIGMADIYSTEEKEVGLWIDNKPLYQITKKISQDISLTANTWATTEYSASGIEKILNCELVNQAGASLNVSIGISNGYIVLNSPRAVTVLASENWWLSYIFTKTNDTPWSGKFVPQGYGYVSSGDIYSFEERQVGVWTDGKPLYQKTIDFGELPNNTTKQVNHNVSNIETVVEIKGVSYVNNLIYGENLPPVTAGKAFRASVRENVVEVSSTDNWTGYNARITFKYTKTTDVAGSGEYVPSGDKAEHYSTDEEVIGTWLGETLYRKVYSFTSNVDISMTTWTDVNTYIPNIGFETFVSCTGVDANGTSQGNILCGTNSSNHVQMLSPRNGNGNISVTKIILEYTKTS